MNCCAVSVRQMVENPSLLFPTEPPKHQVERCAQAGPFGPPACTPFASLHGQVSWREKTLDTVSDLKIASHASF